MRPVRKGSSPTQGDFNKYEDAKADLISRLGGYCSYCERRIPTNLAVEHLEPKDGEHGKPALKNKWSNFLLACVNCNSTKSDKQVEFDKLFFPDRDNTFYSFHYSPDGAIEPADYLSDDDKLIAQSTLKLIGLDKSQQVSTDSNKKQVALDRVSQRMQVWIKATQAKQFIDAQPQNLPLKEMAIGWAKAEGYFSVWMTVFENDSDMKLRLIQAFKGTIDSGCFDMTTGNAITPAPNPDLLQNGGKI